MTSILSHDAFHESIAHAFSELLVLEQLSQLTPDSLLRVLQSIPKPLLRQALGEDAAGEEVVVHAQQEAAPQDQRAHPRRKVLRGGKLFLGHRGNTLDVQVRDVSDGGCRIGFRHPSLLPQRFTIRIVGFDGERDCEVRWRSEEELGVAFLDG